MKLLLPLLLVCALFVTGAWSADWRCAVRSAGSAQERYCYDAETVRYNQRTDRAMVWVKRSDASGDETSHIEVGCAGRMYRVLEEPRDFLGRRTETGSAMGAWKEIPPDSEMDFVKKGVCKETRP